MSCVDCALCGVWQKVHRPTVFGPLVKVTLGSLAKSCAVFLSPSPGAAAEVSDVARKIERIACCRRIAGTISPLCFSLF